MKLKFSLCIILAVWNSSSAKPRGKKANKMLGIVVGGFRWDFLDNPIFSELLLDAAKPKWVVPIWPPVSTTNVETLTNGLFSESHGILGEQFYSYERDQIFTIEQLVSWTDPRWWTAEPLWTTATRQNKKVSAYGSPRCEVPYSRCSSCDEPDSGVLTAKCPGDNVQFDPGFVRFRATVKSAIEDLKGDYDLAAIYTPQLDIDGYFFGPDSIEMGFDLAILADIFTYIKSELKTSGLQNKVNVLINSDHGKIGFTKDTFTFVRLKDYINLNNVRYTIGGAGFCSIITKEGRTNDVYNGLQSMPYVTVYKRKDIPEEFHFKNNVNAPDILIVADPGVFIEGIVNSTTQFPFHPDYQQNQAGVFGSHTYLPSLVPEMNSVLFAWGPDFAVGYFDDCAPRTVDVYGLVCHLLGVEPRPNNGTLSNIDCLLKNPPKL